MLEKVTIYTDGSCRDNPGPGGWAAILIYNKFSKEFSGGEKWSTNQRMELTAAINALSVLKKPCMVDLYSDSKYLVDEMRKGWAIGWRSHGWRTSSGIAKNTDLWERLLTLCEKHKVSFHWVRGHGENKHNIRCDKLAVQESGHF